MYQGPEVSTQVTTAEEFLVGKQAKEQKPEEKKAFTPVFQESYSNPQNEVFTKIHEDPLFLMRREESRQRREIEENPYKIKMLLKQIENDLNTKDRKKNKKEKKEKKSKKDKKEKKNKKSKKNSRRSSSRSSSSDSDRNSKLRIITPSLSALRLDSPDMYGLIDKNAKSTDKKDKSRNLGPDESLLRERKKLLESHDSLYKKSRETKSYKSLTEEEREQMRLQMENKAKKMDFQKLQSMEDIKRKNYHSDSNNRSSHSSAKPNFIKSIEKDVYTSGKMDLEENVKRNKANINKRY